VGAAVAVYVDGDPVVDLWGGFADAARTQPWQRDTIVHVASTTKGMAALCLHRLCEEGRLDPSAPVAHYWPEFAQAGKRRVPVHMLLSHRAGLPAIRRDLPREARYDWKLMAETLAAEEPWWEPGTKHGYHATTFGWLVGEVLRRIDGRTLGRYFRDEIAQPLGLDFHIGLAPEDDARCAEVIPLPAGPKNPIYAAARSEAGTLLARAFGNPPSRRGEFNTAEWRRAEIPAANGHGSARAVARAYAALARGGVLDGVHVLGRDAIAGATTEQAFGPDAVLMGTKMRYGLGFLLTHRGVPFGPNPRAFGHPGMGGSLAFADPDARVGFGYVMNRLQSGVAGDARGYPLIRAVYAALVH
jgi:CubicO group peptidase (beta-lactamase class C family)